MRAQLIGRQQPRRAGQNGGTKEWPGPPLDRRLVEYFAAGRELSRGVEACAADDDRSIAGPKLTYGHFVLRQRAGFIGADNGCGSQALDTG